MNDYFLIDTAIKRAVLNVRMGRYVNALFPTPFLFSIHCVADRVLFSLDCSFWRVQHLWVLFMSRFIPFGHSDSKPSKCAYWQSLRTRDNSPPVATSSSVTILRVSRVNVDATWLLTTLKCTNTPLSLSFPRSFDHSGFCCFWFSLHALIRISTCRGD